MSAQAVVQLFYNPASGSYSPARIDRLARAFAAAGARVLRAESNRDAPAIAEDATHLCVAGGDGTVRHVVMALARSGRAIPAAIFPAGTVNLLAREADYSGDPQALARRLLSGQTNRSHFAATAGGTMFLTCASAGPESMAMALLSDRLKRRIGRLAYVAAFARLLWSWPRHAMRLTANGRTVACEAVYVAKGRYFAGPWSFAPRASVTEPGLHVVALERARRRDHLGFALAMLLGRDVSRMKGVTAFTCDALDLAGESNMPLQADGDIIAALPVSIGLADKPIAFR